MLEFQIQDDFIEPVMRIDGAETIGTFSTPSEKDQPNFEFSAQKLVIRTKHESLLQTGDVIIRQKTGQKFLMAEHTITPSYRVHRLMLVDRLVKWERETVVTDPLTQEKRTTGLQLMGFIWVMWDMIRREAPDFAMQISEEKNLVATGADIRLHDKLDGEEVKRVNRVLGINVAQVQ